MLFARLRRSAALFICPEMRAAKGSGAFALLAAASDSADRHVHQGWLADMKAERIAADLARSDACVRSYFAGNDRLKPVVAVEAGGEAFDPGTDASVSARHLATDLDDDSIQNGLVNGGPRLEKRDTIFSHSSSPVGVGTSQGKEAAGPVKAESRPGRRLDDSLAGDLICVAFLFGLIPLILSLGGM